MRKSDALEFYKYFKETEPLIQNLKQKGIKDHFYFDKFLSNHHVTVKDIKAYEKTVEDLAKDNLKRWMGRFSLKDFNKNQKNIVSDLKTPPKTIFNHVHACIAEYSRHPINSWPNISFKCLSNNICKVGKNIYAYTGPENTYITKNSQFKKIG